jgi:hypothetical protein
MRKWSVVITLGLMLIGFGGWVFSGMPREAQAGSAQIDPDYSLVVPAL